MPVPIATAVMGSSAVIVVIPVLSQIRSSSPRSRLEDLIAAKTGINTMTAEDPMTAVAIGTGKYVEFLAGYRED